VKPEYLSAIGLPLLVRLMREFSQHYEDHKLELAGIVFNATSNYAPEEVKSKREVKANRWAERLVHLQVGGHILSVVSEGRERGTPDLQYFFFTDCTGEPVQRRRRRIR